MSMDRFPVGQAIDVTFPQLAGEGRGDGDQHPGLRPGLVQSYATLHGGQFLQMKGRDALAALVAGLSKDVYYEPGLMVAEGNLVAIHGRIRGWSEAPQVVVDVFRVEGGRLAEHWDVLQDEMPANPALGGMTMFDPGEAVKRS